MASLNSLPSASEAKNTLSGIVNSLDDLKNWLDKNNVRREVIERIAASFMAKIPAGTVVKIVDNMLKVGESMMTLGEGIYKIGEKTQALVEQTNTRAMTIVNHNLPAVQPKRNMVAKNQKDYAMVA